MVHGGSRLSRRHKRFGFVLGVSFALLLGFSGASGPASFKRHTHSSPSLARQQDSESLLTASQELLVDLPSENNVSLESVPRPEIASRHHDGCDGILRV